MYNKQDTKTTKKGRAFPLLDSSLISETFSKSYNIKIIDCGTYTQVYYYQNTLNKKLQNDDFDLKLKKMKIDNTFKNEFKENKDKSEDEDDNKLKEISIRNITRSKLECQRIAKSNIEKWKTFITLTFEDNISDIKQANEEFRKFRSKIRRIKKDFSYIAIPEFQKRGAVHYHILTNIDINDKKLIYNQADNPKFKHVKYWNKGFTSVEIMKGDPKKIVGYISKYMTKDIDNRLFGYHRYFYSQNLNMPKTSYIDSEIDIDNNFYKKIIQDKELIYQNEYINSYDDSKVQFLEFITPNNNIVQQNLENTKTFVKSSSIKTNVNVKTE